MAVDDSLLVGPLDMLAELVSVGKRHEATNGVEGTRVLKPIVGVFAVHVALEMVLALECFWALSAVEWSEVLMHGTYVDS